MFGYLKCRKTVVSLSVLSVYKQVDNICQSSFLNTFSFILDIHRLGIDLSYHMAYDEIFISHLRRLKPTNIAAKVDHYRSDLEHVWEEGERVEALRIVILVS